MPSSCNPYPGPLNAFYLEGQGNFVSRLNMGIIGVTLWLMGVISILTKPSKFNAQIRKSPKGPSGTHIHRTALSMVVSENPQYRPPKYDSPC